MLVLEVVVSDQVEIRKRTEIVEDTSRRKIPEK
jgi:hypothetical protein